MSLNKIPKFPIIKIYTCVSSIRVHLYWREPGIVFLAVAQERAPLIFWNILMAVAQERAPLISV